MNIQISIGQPELAGYTNIDVTKHSIDLANLDNICDSAECTHILLNDVLKFVPYNQIPRVIAHLVLKLRHKGKLTVTFVDLNTIIREYVRGAIDETGFNQLAFEHGANSCFSYDHVVKLLKAAKLELKEITISKEQVVVIAERP